MAIGKHCIDSGSTLTKIEALLYTFIKHGMRAHLYADKGFTGLFDCRCHS